MRREESRSRCSWEVQRRGVEAGSRCGSVAMPSWAAAAAAAAARQARRSLPAHRPTNTDAPSWKSSYCIEGFGVGRALATPGCRRQWQRSQAQAAGGGGAAWHRRRRRRRGSSPWLCGGHQLPQSICWADSPWRMPQEQSCAAGGARRAVRLNAGPPSTLTMGLTTSARIGERARPATASLRRKTKWWLPPYNHEQGPARLQSLTNWARRMERSRGSDPHTLRQAQRQQRWRWGAAARRQNMNSP